MEQVRPVSFVQLLASFVSDIIVVFFIFDVPKSSDMRALRFAVLSVIHPFSRIFLATVFQQVYTNRYLFLLFHLVFLRFGGFLL